MLIRANSPQSVLVDSMYFAVLSGIVAAAVTSIARGADAPPNRAAEIATDRRLTDDHIDSQLNTDDNMPAGNPIETPQAKREAMIFGMKLFERSAGDIRIQDVAATSPAWNAGIRRGDRLLSIADLKPKSLSPWVEDVQRVLADTPDGHSVPVEIRRNDEKLSLRIRLAVSRAAAVRDARQEERALANMAAGNQTQLQQQGQPVMQAAASAEPGHGGYGGGVGGFGAGGFVDDGSNGRSGDDRMARSAVAQLMAVDTLAGSIAASSQTSGSSQAGQSATAPSAGGQVGIAEFQNNGQGVAAVVVIRGLPQGTYQVGIGQGDAMTGGMTGGGFGAGGIDGQQFMNDRNQLDNNQLRNDLRRREQPRRNIEPLPRNGRPGIGGAPRQAPITPQQSNPATNPASPAGAIPSGSGGTGVAPPAGDGASLANPAVAILAQQLDPQQTQAVTGPNQGQVPGQRNMPAANGQIDPRFNNQQGNLDNRQNGTGTLQNGLNQNGGIGQNTGLGNTASPPFVVEIGTLQVGPDGSGRVQNQLEGLAVRNLVGMHVTVVAATSRGGLGVPGNQNNSNIDGRTNRGQLDAGVQQNDSVASVRGGQGTAQPTVVATGVIQLMDGGNVPSLDEGRDGSTPNGQPPVDEETRRQQRQGQFSDPRETFDPSR